MTKKLCVFSDFELIRRKLLSKVHGDGVPELPNTVTVTGTNYLIHDINNKDEIVDTLTQALCGDSLDPAMAQ